MYIKKNIWTMIITGFVLLNTNVFASPSNIKQNFTPIEIQQLNSSLDQQNYISFYDFFKKANVSGNAQIAYLNEKKYQGHVPLYWLMAEYYASIHNESETHKWLYIATIMTQQDAALCSDTSSRFASQKLLRMFPDAAYTVRTSPQYISNAMSETIFFIDNLKTRTNPQWACNFGEQTLKPGANILIPKQNWSAIRKNIFNTYTSKFRK